MKWFKLLAVIIFWYMTVTANPLNLLIYAGISGYVMGGLTGKLLIDTFLRKDENA